VFPVWSVPVWSVPCLKCSCLKCSHCCSSYYFKDILEDQKWPMLNFFNFNRLKFTTGPYVKMNKIFAELQILTWWSIE
jgi:hypothetical protein